jgi:hypothetical protein
MISRFEAMERLAFAAMKTVMISLGALMLVACGGSQKEAIMTPEERLNQQLAEGQNSNAEEGDWSESETNDEEEAKFDKDSAEHAFKVAALSAQDCPNTFEKDQLGAYQPGTATVSLVFENNGAVKDVDVSAPYAGTPVGDCVVRAMSPIHVEPFKGAEVPMTWEVVLEEPKKPEPAKKTDAAKK